MDKRKISAWSLIVFGAIFLSMQLNIITPSKLTTVIFVSIFIGGLLFYKGLNHKKNKGIIGGSFFLMLAFTLSLLKLEIIPTDDQLIIALIIFDHAAANFIYYLFQREYMSNIVFGFISLFIGSVLLIDYYEVIPMWLTVDLLQTYWPVILIAIGILILTKSAIAKKNKTKLI
jgi:hypothetical protein